MAADPRQSRAQAGPAAGQNGGAPGGPPPLEQDFDAGSLYQLRAAVAAHATAAGLGQVRVYDVVAAAHEMAANAVRHGAGRGRLRLRADARALYVQVSDDGPVTGGSPDSAVRAWPVQHGHGLWLIEQVADQFTLDRGTAGTTAAARFTLSSPNGINPAAAPAGQT